MRFVGGLYLWVDPGCALVAGRGAYHASSDAQTSGGTVALSVQGRTANDRRANRTPVYRTWSQAMPFQKTPLKGPCWVADGRAKLSPQQHRRVAVVQRMSCELYNALLESWKNQWLWHQRNHRYDNVTVPDIYDKVRIAGNRGTLYEQFAEYRKTETHNTASNSGVLWNDLSYEIGRGVVNRFDKARASFYQRCNAIKQGSNIKAVYPRFKPQQQWTTIDITAPRQDMLQPPTNGGKWWKLRVKGLGVIKFVPFNAKKLSEELAAGGRIQEARIVTLLLRTEVHLVVRTVTPDPEPLDTPVNPAGSDLGIKQRVTLSNGFAVAGTADDRAVIKKRRRVGELHRWMRQVGHDGRLLKSISNRWRFLVWHSGSVARNAPGSRRCAPRGLALRRRLDGSAGTGPLCTASSTATAGTADTARRPRRPRRRLGR